MTGPEILPLLLQAHVDYIADIRQLDAAQFESAPEGKWSPGEQTDHLLTSIKLMVPAFKLPKLVLRQRFGKANRPSRSYDDLVARYQEKLKLGGKSPERFAPAKITVADRDALLEKLEKTAEKLVKLVGKWSEADLDAYILPHPLLGKVTIREMMMFTVYHVGHHRNIVQRMVNEA